MKSGQWAYFAALALAFIGAVIAISGAGLFFMEQTPIQGSSIWPLPGLVLLEWAGLGTLGFLGALLSNKSSGPAWQKAAWFGVGALLPLAVLGAFSIGLFVLITLLFVLASSVILSILRKSEWLEHLGLAVVGVICNLGLLLLLIAVSNLSGTIGG